MSNINKIRTVLNNSTNTYNPYSVKETMQAVAQSQQPSFIDATITSAKEAFDDSFIIGLPQMALKYGSNAIDSEKISKEQFQKKLKDNDLTEYEHEIMPSYDKYQGWMTDYFAESLIAGKKKRIRNAAIMKSAEDNNVNIKAAGLIGGLIGGAPDFVIPGVAQYGAFNHLTKLGKYGLLAAEGAGMGGIGGYVASWKGETEGEEQDYTHNILTSAMFGAILGPTMHMGIETLANALPNAKFALDNKNLWTSPTKFSEKYKKYKAEQEYNNYTETKTYDDYIKQKEDTYSKYYEEKYKSTMESDIAGKEKAYKDKQLFYEDLTREKYIQDDIDLETARKEELLKQKQDIKDLKEYEKTIKQQNNVAKKEELKQAKRELQEQHKMYEELFNATSKEEIAKLKQEKIKYNQDKEQILFAKIKRDEFANYFTKKYNKGVMANFVNEKKQLSRLENEANTLLKKMNASEVDYHNYVKKNKEYNNQLLNFNERYKDYFKDLETLKRIGTEYKNLTNKIQNERDRLKLQKILEEETFLKENGTTATDYLAKTKRDNYLRQMEVLKHTNDIFNGDIPTSGNMPLHTNEVIVDGNKFKRPTEIIAEIPTDTGNIKVDINLEYKYVDLKDLNIDLTNESIMPFFEPNNILSDTDIRLDNSIPQIHNGNIEYGVPIVKHILLKGQNGELSNFFQQVKNNAKQQGSDIENMQYPIQIKERTNTLSAKETEYLQKHLQSLDINFEERKLFDKIDYKDVFKYGTAKITDISKLLDFGPNKFKNYLRNEGYFYKRTLDTLGGSSDMEINNLLQRFGNFTKQDLINDPILLKSVLEISSDTPMQKYIQQIDSNGNNIYTKTGFFILEKTNKMFQKKDGTFVEREVWQPRMTEEGYKYFSDLKKSGQLTHDIIENGHKKHLAWQKEELERGVSQNPEIQAKIDELKQSRTRETNAEKSIEEQGISNFNQRKKEQNAKDFEKVEFNQFSKNFDDGDIKIIDKLNIEGVNAIAIPRTSFMENFFIQNNKKYEFTYAFIPLEDIQTSNLTDFSKNKLYNKDYQPRDRGDKNSILQITKIANNLDSTKLTNSVDIQTGIPIVEKNNLNVLSGNGRTIGLKLAYNSDNYGYQQYNNSIKIKAKELGIDLPDNHMLVRIIKNDLTNKELIDFAKIANRNEILQQTSTKVAMQEVDILTPETMSLLNSTNYDTIENKQFVKKILDIDKTKIPEYVNEQNQLTGQGINFIDNLLFQKAYKNIRINDLLNSPSESITNIKKTLKDIAPNIIRIQQAIDGGFIENKNFDISQDLMKTVNNIIELRQDGISYQQHLEQAGIFENKTYLDALLLSSFYKLERKMIKKKIEENGKMVEKDVEIENITFENQADLLNKFNNFTKKALSTYETTDTMFAGDKTIKDNPDIKLLKEELIEKYLIEPVKNQPSKAELESVKNHKEFLEKFKKENQGQSKYDKIAEENGLKTEENAKFSDDLKEKILENKDGIDEDTLLDFSEKEIKKNKDNNDYLDDLFNCME